MSIEIKSTTILGIVHNGTAALGGDGRPRPRICHWLV